MRIHGIGVLGGFGTGTDHLLETLKGTRLPVTEMTSVHIQGRPAALPVMRADVSALERFVPKRSLRRIDHYSRMAVLGACLALEDAGITNISHERTGLIIVSGYGAANTTFSFLNSIIEAGDTCASPTNFSNSVHNSAAAHISILLNLTGPSLTISQFQTSVASGLITAGIWLAQERVDSVIFGAVDEYCPVYGYSRLRTFYEDQGKTSGEIPVPESEAEGEGAAFMLLSNKKSPGKYPDIVDVRQGNRGPGFLEIDTGNLLILGNAGGRTCDLYTNNVLKSHPWTADFAHIYGALPVGQAFDLAIGALMIRNREITIKSQDSLQAGSRINSPHQSGFSRVSCLTINPGGKYGLVSLA